MATLSAEIARLRRECSALKQSFEVAGTTLPLTTESINFSTSENKCRRSGGGLDYESAELERIVVTLTTTSGVNTIAKLEVACSGDTPNVRRVPYSGGARWIVSGAPPLDNNSNWHSTAYTFVAQTLVAGTLTARMIWT